MKKRTAWVLVAGVAAVAIGAAGVGALALFLRGSKSGGAWTSDSYLYLRLEGEVPEQSSATSAASWSGARRRCER
jgi:hypothetical protein